MEQKILSRPLEAALEQKKEYLKKTDTTLLAQFDQQITELLPKLKALPDAEQKKLADRIKNFQISEKRRQGSLQEAVQKLVDSLQETRKQPSEAAAPGALENDPATDWNTPGFEKPHDEVLGKNNKYGLPEGTVVTHMGDVGKPSAEHVEKTKGATVPALIENTFKELQFPLSVSDMFLEAPSVDQHYDFIGRWLVYGGDGVQLLNTIVQKMQDKEQRPEVKAKLAQVLEANNTYTSMNPIFPYVNGLPGIKELTKEKKGELYQAISSGKLKNEGFAGLYSRITGNTLSESQWVSMLQQATPMDDREKTFRQGEPLSMKELQGKLLAAAHNMDSYFQETLRYLIKVIPGNKTGDFRGSTLGSIIWKNAGTGRSFGGEGDPSGFQSFASPEAARQSITRQEGVDFWSASNSPTKADVDLFNQYYSA